MLSQKVAVIHCGPHQFHQIHHHQRLQQHHHRRRDVGVVVINTLIIIAFFIIIIVVKILSIGAPHTQSRHGETEGETETWLRGMLSRGSSGS